jgi:hypothetical protein
MTAKVIGNRSAYYRSRQGADGIGGRNLPDGNISWVGIIGKSGDIVYLSASDVTANDKPYVGYAFQAIGGAHKVEFSLVNIATSTDPDPDLQALLTAQNAWCDSTTVTPGTLTKVFYPFAALKITFAADGEFYVVAR